MTRALASSVLCVSLIAGCSSPAEVGPSRGPTAEAPSPSGPQSGSPAHPSPSSAAPTLAPSAAPTLRPSVSQAPLLSARQLGLDIRMAPGANGTLFVSIPRPGGSILTRLDPAGSPVLGWPITVRSSTACELLLPVFPDGSVRVVCTLENPDGNMFSPIAAFAFDSEGFPLRGWPVSLGGSDYAALATGNGLALAETSPGSDVITPGQPSHTIALVNVTATAAVRSGVPVPVIPTWPGDRWAIGPGWGAYGVQGSVLSPKLSEITAIDLTGARPGWPVSVDGIASAPAFGHDGRIILAVASPDQVPRTTRVIKVDDLDGAIVARSSELPIATGMLPPDGDGAYECGVPLPRPPIADPGGTVFVYSEIDDAIYGLDPSLTVMAGWPIVAGELERPDPWLGQDGISCPSLAVPGVGPGGTLYVALKARDESVGGRLLAVGSDGQTRPGWPVELRRAGSEFWAIATSVRGIVYALAIEPEADGGSSATILAIAPDSKVIYATTILNP